MSGGNDFDGVCIVGSGPTGVAAATTLVEEDVPVVMLESGNTFPRRLHVRVGGVDLLWPTPPAVQEPVAGVDFVSGAQDPVRWIKAHGLGGLSNYWSGITLRYSRMDFADGERLHPMYRWPIAYEDLEPYYERAERLMQVRGGTQDFEALPACAVTYKRAVGEEWARFADVCRTHERALAVLPQANGPPTIVSTRGTPQNFALRVLCGLRRSKHFRLIANAHVTRVLVDGNTALANAVEYVDKTTGVFERVNARVVVLAAGPLGSTQILLNSRSRAFPEGLGNSHGVLGRYLHDHPLDYMQVEGDFRFRRLDARRRGGLYVTRESYASSAPLRATAFLLYGGTVFSGLASLNGSSMNVCRFGTQVPCHHNFVLLDPDRKDSYGVPLLQIHTRFSPDELQNMKETGGLMPEMLEEAGNRVLKVTSELQQGGTSVHYGGTARMHESPRYGVVDACNRLHDARNVLVVDASCFTTCAEKNPSLTAVAIAMRAAHRLAAQARTWG